MLEPFYHFSGCVDTIDPLPISTLFDPIAFFISDFLENSLPFWRPFGKLG
jgi:hypothetical protein